MTLSLSDEERDLLERIVKHYLGDLRVEIIHTDDRDFKARLKREEQVVQALLERLAPAASGARG